MATLKKPELRTNAHEESRAKVKPPATGASSREPKTASPSSSRSPASEDKRKGASERRPVQLSYDASDDGYDEESRPAKVKPVRPLADPYDEDGELREIWDRNQKTAAPRPSMSVIGPVAEDPLDRELKKTWERMQAQPSAGRGDSFWRASDAFIRLAQRARQRRRPSRVRSRWTSRRLRRHAGHPGGSGCSRCRTGLAERCRAGPGVNDAWDECSRSPLVGPNSHWVG